MIAILQKDKWLVGDTDSFGGETGETGEELVGYVARLSSKGRGEYEKIDYSCRLRFAP